MKHECFKTELNEDKVMVSRQSFYSTTELAKYVKAQPINKIFKEEKLSSDQEKSGGFNDFDSLEDAIEALEYGTSMYEKDFNKNLKKVQDFLKKKEKNKNANYKNDKVGFLPIVPNVLHGNPINMINQDIKPKPFPTAKIILDKGNSCRITTNDMNEFYSIIFALIQLLENKGIRCEIWVLDGSMSGDEIIVSKLKIKSYTQPLNIYKIQFPIIASDYLRRIGFRIIETNPDIKCSGWTSGYGAPLGVRVDYKEKPKETTQIIGFDENDIFIPSCQEFGFDAGDDIEETIEEIIDKTNLKNYIKINKED